MTQARWITAGEGNSRSYSYGEFVIQWRPPSGGSLGSWQALHKGTRIKSSRELEEIMDYCEKMAARLG